ncbi:MAG: hypothetical protein EOO20_09180 [Chryseobacterium sp.]|nr:MAG: hypothetical protein EOO20_09180 [Chryseobacterium sp.]
MREYPTFFAQAGYSVEEFQNLVNTGIDLGIYNDKLPDAIKEFSLSVTEQTPAVRDALTNAFGEEFTTKLLKGVKDGSVSVKDALVQVSDEARRLGINTQQAQQLTADLFRGAGEDAGGAVKIFEAATKSIENMNRPLTDVEQAMQDLVESEKELAEVQNQALNSEGFQTWANNALIMLNSVKQAFYDTVAFITNSNDELNAMANNTAQSKVIKENVAQALEEYEKFIIKSREILGGSFDVAKATESYMATLQDSLKRAVREKDKFEADTIRAELKAIEEAGKKKLEITNKFNIDEIKASAAANKKRADELEKSRKSALDYVENIYRQYMEKYADGEKAITEIIRKAKKERELDPAQRNNDPTLDSAISLEQKIAILKKRAEEQKLVEMKGAADKQDLAITERWDAEIAKYGDHLDRIAELEAEKAAELKAAKEEREATQAEIEEQKRLDSLERAAEINQALEDERWAKIFSDAEYLAEFELEEQRKRDLAKAEQANASAEEIEAINRKYDERRKKSGVQMVDFFVGLKDQEVKWTALSEEQKMALIKQGLNIAADMFNKGSGAWKALKIAETTITTFQAAMNAYNSLSGIPIVGPALGAIAAGVVAAAGAKAVSNIAKTKVDKQPKFFYGGYTGKKSRGSDQFGNIVGDVHEDEFVIPKAMTQNPIYADTLAWLERDRQRIYGSAGDAQPLPVSGSGSGASTSGRYQRAGTDENTIALVATLNSLQGLLQKGIPAIVNFGYQDVEELNKMNDEISKSNKNATLNQ